MPAEPAGVQPRRALDGGWRVGARNATRRRILARRRAPARAGGNSILAVHGSGARGGDSAGRSQPDEPSPTYRDRLELVSGNQLVDLGASEVGHHARLVYRYVFRLNPSREGHAPKSLCSHVQPSRSLAATSARDGCPLCARVRCCLQLLCPVCLPKQTGKLLIGFGPSLRQPQLVSTLHARVGFGCATVRCCLAIRPHTFLSPLPSA